MPSPKRVPVEVVEKARAVATASRTQRHPLAPTTAPAPPAPSAKKKPSGAREKVVQALKRLHPMD
jgi:hypothetical protein